MSDFSTMPAADLLTELGWIPAGRHVTAVASAGAGNMNLVERITYDDGSTVILKRARAWVEKYPDIPAPVSRARVEADFYQAVLGSAAGAAMPAHLGFDEASGANLFADLGEGADGMAAYGGQIIELSDIEAVVRWMADLHAISVPAHSRFDNKAMRELNALHIFDFPLDPASGFDVDLITPGLQTAADRLKHDPGFVMAVKAAKSIYLSDAPGVLLHGDLYPGSWLKTPKGIFVIDPEFCWVGPPEWDLGVLTAHLWLSGQSASVIDRSLPYYGGRVDCGLVDLICGIEIMRRLIGVAQLPLPLNLTAKRELLDIARALVLGEAR